MDTSVKLDKEFLKLLDCVRATGKDNEYRTITRIHCKENVLYSTNGAMALKCDLKQEQLPEFQLKDGFYEIAGNYLVQDKEMEGTFPDVERILNSDFTECFRPLMDTERSYMSFIHTISHKGIQLNYVQYERQFKQVFRGSDYTVFFGEDKRGVVLIEFSYPILPIGINLTANVSFLIMPIPYELPEIKGIKYNPTKDEKPFPKEDENLV